MSKRTTSAARNTVYNSLGYGWRLILSLIVTPFLLTRLTNDAYGVFMLVLLINNYLEYLYFGMGESVTKSISACRDGDSRKWIINSAFFTFVALGGISAIGFAVFTGFFLLETFQIPPHLADNSRFVFYVLAAAFALNLPFTALSSAMRGLQRMDLLNRLLILQATLANASMLVALGCGYGLREMIIAYTGINTLGNVANFSILKHVFPAFEISWRWFDWKETRSLFRFGVPSTIGGLSYLVIYYINIPMLGMFLPLGVVTYYIVANQLASQIWVVSSMAYMALFPLVSELFSEKNLDAVRELYSSATVLILSVTSPLAVTLFVLSDRIFLFWLGKDFQPAVLPLQVLNVAWLISTLASASSFTSRGIGRPRIDATLASAIALANVGLNFLIIPVHAIPGALAATFILQALGSAANIWIVTRLIRIESRIAYLGRILKVFLASLLPAGIMYPAWQSLPVTAAQGALYLVSYALIVWRFCWTEGEKRILRSILPPSLEKFFSA